MIGTLHPVDLHRPASSGVRLLIFAAEDGGRPRHIAHRHVAPHEVHLNRRPDLRLRSAPVVQQAAVVQRTARVGFVDQAQIRRPHRALDTFEDRGVYEVAELNLSQFRCCRQYLGSSRRGTRGAYEISASILSGSVNGG